jgi:hypothetical protein
MLMPHLKVLENRGLIRIFTRQALAPGTLWREEMQSEISNSVAAILLVTPEYLESDDIREGQLTQLLSRAKDHGTAILPLLVKPSMFSTVPELSRFLPFNPISKTLDEPKTLIEMVRPGEKERFLVSVAKAVQEEVHHRRADSGGDLHVV